MSTEFEFFEGSATIHSTTPQATVRRSGHLILTQAAVELLGEGVERVQVGYNAKTGAVGIRPAPEGGRGALRLRKQPNSRSRLIDAKRFFAHHGLKLGQARRVPVEDFSGGLIGFMVDGGKRQEEPPEPKATAKAPKGRNAAG
jgi:hypothetical protein